MEDALVAGGFGSLTLLLGVFLVVFSVIEKLYARELLVGTKAQDLVKWAERFAGDPAVRGPIPDSDKLIEHGKSLQNKWGDAITNE